MNIITKELKDTLLQHPEIQEVHFDEQGRHYLRVLDLIEKKGDRRTSLYGDGVYSHSEVIPGRWNVDKMQDRICKGVPDTKIVNTLTRDEVLEYKDDTKKESLMAQFANLSESDKNSLLNFIGKNPNPHLTPTPSPTPHTPPTPPAPTSQNK